MKDIYGRINDNSHVIREVSIRELATILMDIKTNPSLYPNNINDWVEWLQKDSDDYIDGLLKGL